ncbi:DUF3291 domain-containing protein [Sphingomonas sp. KR1UV-12]|uniref:DUF3291 domain-containing protein n=1 Tax=Sphingomonas aurea TaxID=3063994 RepID=A0ABT9EFM3_9SPHN|nr:DUF3291 domain-containing protein [Sphingomonas sp. KR1UV-12]MDP1025761.1 DUF3291 domain-containing protein [Sphingomonas sp. KR1UV-12]
MTFVSITRLRIRAFRFMPAFALHTWRAQRQVERAAGIVGGSLLADRKLTFWTMTLWRDRSDMRAYMTSGDHLTAMPRLLDWCDQVSIAHWDQETPSLPGWADADGRMRIEGRPSKVRHPAPGHADMSFAPPRLSGAVPIRAKTPASRLDDN